jgi:hypothetical protein
MNLEEVTLQETRAATGFTYADIRFPEEVTE